MNQEVVLSRVSCLTLTCLTVGRRGRYFDERLVFVLVRN